MRILNNYINIDYPKECSIMYTGIYTTHIISYFQHETYMYHQAYYSVLARS